MAQRDGSVVGENVLLPRCFAGIDVGQTSCSLFRTRKVNPAGDSWRERETERDGEREGEADKQQVPKVRDYWHTL